MKKFFKVNISPSLIDTDTDEFETNLSHNEVFHNVYGEEIYDKILNRNLNVRKTPSNSNSSFSFKVKKQVKHNEAKVKEKINSPHLIGKNRLSELEESNLYYILDIDYEADHDKIKKAYKALCKKYHPDKGGDPSEFAKVHNAYKILSNELCKSLYDKFASEALDIINYILSNENALSELCDSSNIVENFLDDIEALKIIVHMKK
jgi:hypothetical protein